MSFALREMPEDFEIRPFLVRDSQEVTDMMLAEDQEFDALELVGKAREKTGEQKTIDQTIERMLTSGFFTDEQISIATGKDFKYIQDYREKIINNEQK